MEKGFTLIEVVILFVIFLTVAALVIPLSVDDALTTKNITKWKNSKHEFVRFSSALADKKYDKTCGIAKGDFIKILEKYYPLKNKINYPIKYMNGDVPEERYCYNEIYTTDNGAAIAFNLFEDKNICGTLMYDVNGKKGPNVWGKDVFGFNIYPDKLEPLGDGEDNVIIEADCSGQGTGLYCSSYYLKKRRITYD